jgi:hypothetical protein
MVRKITSDGESANNSALRVRNSKSVNYLEQHMCIMNLPSIAAGTVGKSKYDLD